MQINSQQMEELLEIIKQSTGSDLAGYRPSILLQQFSNLMDNIKMDAAQYLSLCRSDASECKNLVNAISIHVSSFFRNPIVFEILTQSVISRLIEKAPRELRVWSAGCATGDEVYSVAILIKELLKRFPSVALHPLLFATDIDQDVLTKAKRAFYARESLKSTKLGWVDAYFSTQGEGFQLCDEVRKMVYFSVNDLLAPHAGAPVESIYGSFDLILCRNVLIYFSARHQEEVLKKLYDALAIGGYLVLGDTETLVGELKSRFKIIDAKNKIYQK